ncbi:antileukoproteinase [Mesoplodon densirostris]|uniref:antileukoproteinase n=1 Tax=Mesoplodon densirostris TaxID=48708 RepID=UPI0028DB4900|nr:antileukoproteinase [Mesoplodon densirostris]
MTYSGLFPFVLLALGTLAPWAVEGSVNALKAGACPTRKSAQCLRYEKPECKNDWQCPEKKICCPDTCRIKCMDPVLTLNPVEEKAGKCPVVDSQCLMFNPPNNCEKDGECLGTLKCCKGTCGKACISPVKGKEGLGQADLLPSGSLSLNPLEFQAYKQGDS